MDRPVADPETVLKEELPATASWGELQSSNIQDDRQKCSESTASWSEQRSTTVQDDGQTCPERCPEDSTIAEWVNHDDTTRTATTAAVALPTGDAANGRSGERDDRKEADLAENGSTERADTEQVRGSNADSSVGKAGYESICRELEQNPVETDLSASDDTQWKVEMELSTTEAAPVSAEAASQSAREAQDGAQQYNAADTAQTQAKTVSSSMTTSMGSRFAETEARNTDNSSDSLQTGDFPSLDASHVGGKTRNVPAVARDRQTSGMPGSGMGHALHGDRERGESSSFEKPADDRTLPGVAPDMRCPSSFSGPDNSLVHVAGMDQSMDLNLLQLYFGNAKRSGGGNCTIRDDQRHQRQAYVILSFEDQEVAARVLNGRHHKLSGKSLVVSPAGASPLSRTVRVEGGSVATSAEAMELYFDDPKNSGGDIEKIYVDDKQITWITFQEARVADEVVKMQHTLFGVPLTVTKARGDGREPGTSITPPGHPSQAHQSQPHQTYGRDEEEDPDEATTLKATFTAGSPTPSSRHGSFSSSTLSVAIISRAESSCESELYQRGASPEPFGHAPFVDGLQRHHANRGQASAFRPSQPTSLHSLHPARNLGASAGLRHSLPRNFNGRSDPLGRLGAIPSTTATAPIARASAGPREEGCSGSSGRDGGFEASTVAIRGLRRSTSLDAVRSYFDNTRMSGGGEVLGVRLSPVVGGTAFVTFRHEQDAANVKARGHKLEDKDLKVVDVVRNQLLLGGLPHCVSEDLKHFVEVKARSALETVKFGEDGSAAIVTFEEEIALQHVRDSLTAHSFKGKTLHVEPVPVTDTILVRNLPRAPLLTEESLKNLFSNTRYSGGEGVISVILDVGNNYALIAFADPSVASRVAGRKIQYHQRQLDISLFNDCLGPSGGLAEQPLRKPQPEQITEVERVKKISLLTKVPSLASRLRDVLEQCHARLDPPDNAGESQQVSLVCTLSADVEGAPCLAASWTEDATSALNDHLQKSVYVKSEPLNADAGDGGVTWVQNLADEAGVGAVFDEKAGTVYVLCDRDESRERVDAIIARIQAGNTKRREAKVTLQVPIAKGKLPLLKSHHVGKEIREKFPELCVAFEMDKGRVSLEGAEEAVSAMRASVEEVSGLIKSKAHRWNSPAASLLQSSTEARNAVEMACRKESSEGSVHFNDSGFEVYSFCEEEAEQMLSRGADAVKEKILQIDEGLKTALGLPEWEDFRKSVEEESEGLVLFVQTDASLTMVGVGPAAHERFKAVDEFLEEHVLLKRTIALGMPFPAVLQTLLRKKHEDEHLRVHDFALGKNACEVVVEGNKAGIQTMEELVKELTNLSALPQE